MAIKTTSRQVQLLVFLTASDALYNCRVIAFAVKITMVRTPPYLVWTPHYIRYLARCRRVCEDAFNPSKASWVGA